MITPQAAGEVVVQVGHVAAHSGSYFDEMNNMFKGEGNMFGQRQGIIVWLYTLKQAKMLRKFGNIHYVSKRFKYVVLYCDLVEVEAITDKLNSYSFVKKVEPSYKPFLKIEFENKKPDKAKEYDYKMGI